MDEDFAMTSMIDVVFLLLVFFVWTSSFDRPEADLRGQLAMRSEPTDPAKRSDKTAGVDGDLMTEIVPEQVVIRIRPEQPTGSQPRMVYEIGAFESESIESVRARLATIAKLEIDTVVIIDPDGEVPMEDAIAVFDAARAMRFRRVLFAVDF